jgi:RNA polymerase sigma factor (TIGR02999 family)
MSPDTYILNSLDAGDPKAAEELLKLVYQELRRLAAFKMAQQPPGQTLQPTALVHEAWLKIGHSQNFSFKNRAHFFSAAAEAMRCILIDRARRKQTQRHGGGTAKVEFDEFEIAAPAPDDQLVAVNDALTTLAAAHPMQAEVVKLRYFVGLTNEDVAALMGISVSTVKNYWNFARAWLFSEIRGE